MKSRPLKPKKLLMKRSVRFNSYAKLKKKQLIARLRLTSCAQNVLPSNANVITVPPRLFASRKKKLTVSLWIKLANANSPTSKAWRCKWLRPNVQILFASLSLKKKRKNVSAKWKPKKYRPFWNIRRLFSNRSARMRTFTNRLDLTTSRMASALVTRLRKLDNASKESSKTRFKACTISVLTTNTRSSFKLTRSASDPLKCIVH